MSVFHPHSPEDYYLKRKVNFLYVFFSILLGGVLIRLIYLQVVKYEKLYTLSERNRIRNEILYPERGYILDRNGIIIAHTRPSFDIYVVPEEMGSKEEYVLERLSYLLNLNPEQLRARYNLWKQTHRDFESFLVKEDVDYESLFKVEVERVFLPGIHIVDMPVRRYRHERAFSHLIGYLGEISEFELKGLKDEGYSLGDIIGKTGIEQVAERFLHGKKGWEQIEVDATGRKVEVLRVTRPVKGQDVYLTMDARLQEYAYSLIEGKKGSIIAMNPQNGEVLVYSVSPSFVASDFIRGIDLPRWIEYLSKEGAPLFNRGISATYPPGSTIKPFIAIAGLEEKLITPSTHVKCPGYMWIGNRRFSCWKKEGHGVVNLIRAISSSCDVYFYKLALNLGAERITRYLTLFGFGAVTGSIFNEKKGLTPDSRKNGKLTPGEVAGVGIGQGHVLITPLQLLRAYSALVNGGYLVKPRFIMKIAGQEGMDVDPPFKEKLPLREENLKIIKKALFEVVNGEWGTARWLKSKTIEMGGKTGTAQVVKLEKYKMFKEKDIPEEYRDHALFVGFAPYENPEIVAVAIIEHGGHGSTGAAPLVKSLIEKYFELKKE